VDVFLTAGDAGFKVDDAIVRTHAVELVERNTQGNDETAQRGIEPWAVSASPHIIQRGFFVTFMQSGIARVRRDLIDATTNHHIAAEEEPH
jgi:hypothetical protein